MDAEARDSSTNPKEFQVFLLSCLVEDCNDEVLEVLDVAKSPQEDVETLSESHEMVTVTSLPEEEESIQESRGDVVTTAAKFPHDDAVEEDLEEENDDKSAKAKLISMTTILMICTNILCTRQIF